MFQVRGEEGAKGKGQARNFNLTPCQVSSLICTAGEHKEHMQDTYVARICYQTMAVLLYTKALSL